MFKKIVGTVAIGALGVGLYYGAAFSTPSSGQTNTSILVGTFDQLDVKKYWAKPVCGSGLKRMWTS